MARTGTTDPGDRTFARIAMAVGALSTLVFGWVLTLGRGDLLAERYFAEVFDVQGRALLDGRLWVPDGSLGFEGFVIDGRTYAYFGLFPSIIRLPVLWATERFDGRLGGASMLVAYVVALWAATMLVARVRRLARPGRPWTGTGLVVATATLVVVGIGSNLLFLASGTWVYHEASMWGAAGVLASFAALLRHLERGGGGAIVAAGAWALVAWMSRGSVGLAPSVALGLVGLARATEHPWLRVLAPAPAASPPDAQPETDVDAAPGLDERTAPSGRGRWAAGRTGAAVGLLAASAVGALCFAAVNTAKFGSPTELPMDAQLGSQTPWPGRVAALEAYDGSLFSARLVPSVAIQSLRPDLLEPTGTWPFLGFSGRQPPVWGDLVFDTVEPSAGLTVTSPLLLVLGSVGAVAALRRRSSTRADVAFVRPLLLGGLAATWAPLTIAFIAQRYLTDALPLLLAASAAGIAVIDGWADRRGAGARTQANLVRGGVVALAVIGVATTMVVTWTFQRFVIPPDAEAEAAALRAQVAVSRIVGDPPSVDVRPWPLSDPADRSVLVVVGDCDGLYRGQDDGGWVPIEVGASGGRVPLGADLSGIAAGAPVAIATIGEGPDRLTLTAVATDPGRVRLGVARGGAAVASSGAFPDVEVEEGPQRIELRADPTFAWTQVLVDGEQALFVDGRPPAERSLALGADPGAAIAPSPVAVEVLATSTPTCDALVEAGT